MGELFARKPLMQGRSTLDQLKITNQFIGSPAEEDLWYVKNKQAKRFMMKMRQAAPIDYHEAFPDASNAAKELMAMMLVWDPAKRASCDECLQSEFITSVRSGEDDDTIAKMELSHLAATVDLSDIEAMPLTVANLRHKMFEEIRMFHDELEEKEGERPAEERARSNSSAAV